MEERYLTVTALTKYIKYKFDHDTNLKVVLLEGEISNFKHNSRGHFYFTLKDENASISAIMFATNASNVKFEPADGMKVFVKGSLSVYEQSGSYQIYVNEMKSDGVGDLYLAYEKLKRDLERKGLFDVAHKKPIPRFPKTVGVVTSPTGAAVRDIIKTIERRYPLCNVILYPAIVQGDKAKDDVVKQINKANKDNLCDVLIIGRGGGSIEDLWCFNEEIVAYAIYNSKIPTISAVGHEIDFTIADFVADMRAVTPTGGAELATPDLNVLKQNVNYYVDTMTKKINYLINDYKIRLVNIDKRLDTLNPIQTLKHKKEILNMNYQRLNQKILELLNNKKHIFELYKNRLEASNPLAIMDKGYSINKVNGHILTNVKNVNPGDLLTTELKNGSLISKVMEVKENGK